MDKSFYNIALKFLQIMGYYVDKDVFLNQLCSHVNYPALNSFTDVLEYMEVDNVAVKIDAIKLNEYGFPVMIHMNDKLPHFIIVTNIREDKVCYYNLYLKKKTVNIDSIFKYWDGTALYIQNSNDTTSLLVLIKRIFEKIEIPVFVIAFISLLLIFLFYSSTFVFFYLLFVIKTFALLVSFLILRHELGKSSSFENKLCSFSKNVNCDKVLNSFSSKILGIFRLSDMSLLYFSSGLLSLLYSILIKDVDSLLGCLCFISFFSFPVLLYSLIYQKYVIKKWCLLCLNIAFALILEIILSIFYFKNNNLNLSFLNILVIGAIFIFLIVLWKKMYYLIIRNFIFDDLSISLNALKHNDIIFESVLNRQVSVNMDFSKNDLIIGNKNAHNIITIAMSLHCPHCISLYRKLKKNIDSNALDVALNIRLVVTGDILIQSDLELKMMSLYYKDIDCFSSCLDDWDFNDVFLLSSYNNIDLVTPFVINEFERHKEWSNFMAISSTPLIFINDKIKPDIYSIDDLLYFIRNLK